jgi:hypothetical protein
MAGKQLYFKFVDGGAQGVVQLYEADAPQTVAAIWQALAKPVRIPAMHAMFAGPEIMLGLVEGLDAFAAACQRIRLEGVKTVEIGRL